MKKVSNYDNHNAVIIEAIKISISRDELCNEMIHATIDSRWSQMLKRRETWRVGGRGKQGKPSISDEIKWKINHLKLMRPQPRRGVLSWGEERYTA